MNYLQCKAYVDKYKNEILDAERYIWKHPESGFREWNTSAYLAGLFEKAGYEVQRAGNIPGFYADLDTGRPGPRVLILGEMDGLLFPEHPDSVEGYVHACGHNTQCAALLGVALALKEPDVLEGISGSVRFMAVPAEELIEIDFRNSLRKRGIIRYLSGKTEFLYRGYMDGCDIAFMIHVGTRSVPSLTYNNYDGNMAKLITYRGKGAHSGAHAERGVNALYAATMGIQAINSLRETFQDKEHVRIHPIITAGGDSADIIPSLVKMETHLRGVDFDTILDTNAKINRAIAASALAVGAEVMVEDRGASAPLIIDEGLKQVIHDCAVEVFGEENVYGRPWSSSSTDIGDVSCVMRTLHADISGASGCHHETSFQVTDPYMACVICAVIYVMAVEELLGNQSEKAKEIIAGPPLRYPNKEAFFADFDRLIGDKELVRYTEDGAVVSW